MKALISDHFNTSQEASMLSRVASESVHPFASSPLPRCLAVLAVAAVLAACGGAEAPPQPREDAGQSAAAPPSETRAAAGGTGSLSGRLTFSGAAPAAEPVNVTKDRQVCGAHSIVKEDLIVGPDGGLRNVVVSVQGVPGGDAHALPEVELRQKGCVFLPHVAVVAAGRPLAVFNDDGILHNIHTFSTLNRPINKAQPKFLKRIEVQFDRPETIRVTCDAHPWMSSWIVVSDHPYVALSDEGGSFRIGDVPAGSYTVRLWHETLGERTQEVVVRPAQTTDLSVAFGPSS
jgi:plastocyanin